MLLFSYNKLNGFNLQNLNTANEAHVKEFENISDNIKKGLFEIETIDIGSVDTGRGSSIASSPPEYFPDSPLNAEDVRNKTKLVDIATSPQRRETINFATSPILFEHLSPPRDADRSTNRKIMVNKAVSPIKCTDVLKHVKSVTVQTTSSISDDDKVVKHDQHHEDNIDLEIELILNKMRLEHSFITPLPLSPPRFDDNETQSLSTIFESCENSDVGKLRDDNKKLQSNMELIKKEMIRLKRFILSMDLDDEFERFMNVSLINETNATGTIAEDIVQMENAVSPVHSIVNDDNVTLDLPDDEDILTSDSDKPQSEKQHHILTADTDEPQLEKQTQEADSSNIESTENDHVASCKDCEANKKIVKSRKISKLDKLKKRMLPKSKIRRLIGPPKRLLRSRIKRLSPYNRSSPVISKQQEAYSKAVLVWKQLNSKKRDAHDNDTAKVPISIETIMSSGDANKSQSKNELSPNKLDSKLKNSQLQKQTNKSRERSEATSGDESYDIKTRKSSISSPEYPVTDDKNIISIDSGKKLFVVLERSLSEKVDILQKEHAKILNTVNNTVKLPKDAKSLKVSPVTEPKISSKRILRNSSTTETNEDNENKLTTENVVSWPDLKSPPTNEPEDIKIQTRMSLRRGSKESQDNSDEEVISNNKKTHNENMPSQGGRGGRNHLDNTKVPNRRILRSSNQLPNSPMSKNDPESQKIGNLVCCSESKQHVDSFQRQGYPSTSTDNTLVCSDTNRRRSAIQQSGKNASEAESSQVDNDSSSQKRKGRKRKCQDILEIQNKRTLRSSAVVQRINRENMEKSPSSATCNEMLHGDKPKSVVEDMEKETKGDLRNNKEQSNAKNKLDSIVDTKQFKDSIEANVTTNEKCSTIPLISSKRLSNKRSNEITCNDLKDSEETSVKSENGTQIHENDDTSESQTSIVDNRQNSILCKGIEKYGLSHDKNSTKKLSGNDLLNLYCAYLSVLFH